MAARKDKKGRVLRRGEFQRASDNRYVYEYTDPFGKRRCIYATDLMKLRQKEQQLMKDQLDGLDVYVAGKSDLNFVFERYMSTKSDLRSSTYTNYVYMYDRFVRETFGKKKIAEIKYSDVLYFYNYLIKEQGLQVNTLDNVHSLLHPTFQLAVRDNLIRTNPSDGVMAVIKKRNKKDGNIRHALTVGQQSAFIKFARENPVYCRWAPLFTVLLGTGGRIGEIIGLRWADLDFEGREISINHSISYGPRSDDDFRCSYSVSLPKTEAGIRIIPMMDAVFEAFQDEYEYQKEEGFNEMVIDGMSGFIFTNRFGNIHNPQGVNRAIKRVTEAYNAEEIIKANKEDREPLLVPHFSCHHMRHTFCTRLCEQISNVKVIQTIMGHKDIETTLGIYADVTEETKKDTMKKLANEVDVF